MKRFTFRVPDDLHERLVARASREERSLHSLVLLLVREGLGDKPSGSVGNSEKGVGARKASGSRVEAPVESEREFRPISRQDQVKGSYRK